MKYISILILIFLASQNLLAATNYVSKTGGHISPFDSWANAATNIQAAVNAAFSGNIVLVNEGTYYPANQINITKNITLKSVNGMIKTIIDGGFPGKSNRCFYIDNGDKIDGFTIKHGYAHGSGGNMYSDSGGGVYLRSGGIVQNCKICENTGGGVFFFRTKGIVQNCIICSNSETLKGGGVYYYMGGTIKNCVISNNSASASGGGIYFYRTRGDIINSLIYGNQAKLGGGIYCDDCGTIQNCTIINNYASDGYGGGVFCDDGGVVQNSILYGNTNENIHSSISSNNQRNNCVEGWTNLVNGIITNTPQFISTNDFRLQSISPCRNSGTNLQYVFETFDLGGNSRIMGYTVDIGAYEFIESIQYCPALVPVINNSKINYGKISWTPKIYEIPRAENFIVQEKRQDNWLDVYNGTNSSFLFQRLTSAYYRVAAVNNIGTSDWSSSVFYSNYPIVVTTLNAEQIDDGSGLVIIQTKVNDSNRDLSKLKLNYSLNNGATWETGSPFIISAVQNGYSPIVSNSSEYQVKNIMPNNSVVTLVWDTISIQNGGGSLSNQRIEQAKIKIKPQNGYSLGYTVFSLPFVIDNTSISNVSVIINNNAITTVSQNVSLQLHAEGTAPLSMRISNGLNFKNSLWLPYAISNYWLLSPGNGVKTVYVQFKNEKGDVLSAQDSIFLNNLDYSNFEGTNDITFLMGREGSIADEAPAHTVNLTTCAMYKTEISNVEFAQFVSEGGYQNSSFWSAEGWAWQSTNNVVCPLYWNTNDTPNYINDPYSNSDDKPVVGISYYEAEAYAKWADYELPTEAEWEFFAKGVDNRHYPWADDFWYTSSQPNYYLCNWKIGFDGYSENGFTNDGAAYAANVTDYPDGKGICGHYNLSGNVAEWVKDWYGNYGSSEETDPEGPTAGTERVIRGGSFVHGRDDLTTTVRMHYPPEFRTNWLGMRVAKNDVVPEPGSIYYLSFIIYYLLMIVKKR